MHSVPFLCCSFCFHCLTYWGKSLCEAQPPSHLTDTGVLCRLTSTPGVAFKPLLQNNQMMINHSRKNALKYIFKYCIYPSSYCSSYKHSSSEGITNAEPGWGDAGKLYFQAVFLVSPRILLVDLKQANCIPFPISTPNSKGGESLLQSTLRPTKDKRNVRSWYYYSFCSSCLLQEIPQRSDI